MSLSTALSGLQAFQRALDTTSHNISNVSTEGYSRQRVELATRTPDLLGQGYIGTGVQTLTVERAFDQYVVDQVISRTSSYNQFSAYGKVATELDISLGNPDSGLTSTLEKFFNAVQTVSSDPTSMPAREVLLAESGTLNSRFHSINSQIDGLRAGVNSQIGGAVAQVNQLAESISDLNNDIVRAAGEAGGGLPNDLLDSRDRLIEKLSELVGVKTTTQSDLSMSVYIGSGQALVLGGTFNTLATVSDEFDPLDQKVSLANGGVNVSITEQLTGGILGGLLNAKKEILDPMQNSLGVIAMGLADVFNTQHQLGEDLAGNAGGLFFTDVNSSAPAVLPGRSNAPASGNFSITIDDVDSLKPSDYRLNYDGANFSLLRLSDNKVVDSGFTTASLPRTVASEGITLTLAGSVAAGDSFLVRPVHYAAGEMGLEITDPSTFAAAGVGTGVGNNDNALSMSALQTSRILSGGTASLQESYGIMITGIAVKTNQATSAESAQRQLLNYAVEARSSVSGVNLDEEAANMIKFQQGYQASAQVISAIDDMFQVLINAVS